MKKLFVILAAALLAVNANAQLAIIGGLTSTQTDVKSAIADVKTVNQYHIGLAYKIPFGSFAIQPALEYNVKGSALEDITGTADINFKTGFVELPVQVQWGIDLAVARPYIFAEPFIGYAVTNAQSAGIKELKAQIENHDWDGVANRFEYGLGIGLGVEVFKHVQVSARYFWNLGTLYDFSWAQVREVKNTKCSGITASVAFLF